MSQSAAKRLENFSIPITNLRLLYMTHPTVLTSTVATWINDLNPKQLRAVARNATPLKTRVLDVVRRVLSGRGGATDPHGHTECSGVNSNRPISGRSRGIKFACVHPSVSGRHGQNGEASGRVPEVLHSVFFCKYSSTAVTNSTYLSRSFCNASYTISSVRIVPLDLKELLDIVRPKLLLGCRKRSSVFESSGSD